MQSIAETCVRFDAAHLSINLVSEIAVPMFTTLMNVAEIHAQKFEVHSRPPVPYNIIMQLIKLYLGPISHDPLEL